MLLLYAMNSISLCILLLIIPNCCSFLSENVRSVHKYHTVGRFTSKHSLSSSDFEGEPRQDNKYHKINENKFEVTGLELQNPQSLARNQIRIFGSIASIAGLTLFSASKYLPDAEAYDEIISTIKEPEITAKVYLDVKIANYTEESVGTNIPAKGSGRIVIGLYGKSAPNSVQQFLETIRSNGSVYPSYVGAQLERINEENGLLQLESTLRGLEIITIAGTDEYEYKGKLMNYQPIIERNGIAHDRKGLLTRNLLTKGPEFAITTRVATEQLNAFHIVFGTILEGMEVLDAILKIPVYTYKTKTGYGGQQKGIEGNLADSWFESQKKFYVSAGQTFGDRRAVDRRGKLLRRVRIIDSGDISK